MTRATVSSEKLAQGVLAREPAMLSQAISLSESSLIVHQMQAQDVLQQLLSRTGKAMRIRISGALGVGKSTFIEALGLRLIEQGHRVAVLAIDSGNQQAGGGTLRDNNRMAQLSLRDEAYIRHAFTRRHPEGMTRIIHEPLLLCEAAGFDVILIETIGTGLTDAEMSDVADCNLHLMIPGVDGELQSIKEGKMVLADIVALTTAEGKTISDTRQTQDACQLALSGLLSAPDWQPVALCCSTITGEGLDELWQCVRTHRRQLIDTGELVERRAQQRISWMWSIVDRRVLSSLRKNAELQQLIGETESAVRQQKLSVLQAANAILAAWRPDHPGARISPEPGPKVL